MFRLELQMRECCAFASLGLRKEAKEPGALF